MNKIRVGIFFGGRSREREVSFAGGRTVYDNLDKSLFEPIPVFVDSFNQFIILDWQYVYKGTIRDFYPPVQFIPSDASKFQIYAESLTLTDDEKKKMASSIGEIIQPDKFKSKFDIAFLALHGSYGEDGSLQGLLEWFDIPYTGSGIFGTALGINKKLQKQLMPQHELYSMLPCESVNEKDWFDLAFNTKSFYQKIKDKIRLPLVIKSANQGSSIGVSFLKEDDFEHFCNQVNRSFFRESLNLADWNTKNEEQKEEFVKNLIDIRGGLGLPLEIEDALIYTPTDLLYYLQSAFSQGKNQVKARAFEHETEVLFEPFLKGKEFSCIVVKKENGEFAALPPTEIVKKQDLFDYRSKYLPGLSRKVTPMQIEPHILHKIRKSCEHLSAHFNFKVYARIDGFLTEDGQIYLNDPNTTSGMMPSSFFFHQAAEIGLSPSEFITLVLKISLQERINSRGITLEYEKLMGKLEQLSNEIHSSSLIIKDRIAVIFGGNSFERHISVESGRNVFEKLNSSGAYEVTPVFLDYTDEQFRFFKLPISMMLKDNADDIREKVLHFKKNPVLQEIRNDLNDLTKAFAKSKPVFEPIELSFSDLKSQFDGVFMALHGRPGEDGTLQKELDALGIYYNGSNTETSSITIDKFKTIQLLSENGFPVTQQLLIHKQDWETNSEQTLNQLDVLGYPMILKPHDDGCSAAVLKIKSREGAAHFANLIFRENDLDFPESRKFLGVKESDEFPQKNQFLAEKLITSNNATHFLEITGGMLTQFVDEKLEFLVFEPSEALSEGEVLSLEEKFLAGQGQNITPARYSADPLAQIEISQQVKEQLLKVAKLLNIQGYCRIDAFVRIFEGNKTEVIVIEVNSLPGMTPATCIYHQAALESLKPFDFIDGILKFGKQRLQQSQSHS